MKDEKKVALALHKVVIFAVFGMLLIANNASAVVLNFGTSNLMTSTVTTHDSGGYFNGLNAPNVPALPDDTTFTLPFAGNNTLLSMQGKFWRYNFTLPTGFSNLTFGIETVVNDEVAIYLNDAVIAIQDDTGVPTNAFILNADNSVTDSSDQNPCIYSSCISYAWGGDSGPRGWDFLSIDQTMFQVGLNELTIYATDTCCLQSGQVAGSLAGVSGKITYDVPPPSGSVPEPATLALLALGLAGIGSSSRKK